MLNNQLMKALILMLSFSLFLSTSASTATAQYTYDNLNRLVQVQYDDGTVIQYTYDAAGNLEP